MSPLLEKKTPTLIASMNYVLNNLCSQPHVVLFIRHSNSENMYFLYYIIVSFCRLLCQVKNSIIRVWDLGLRCFAPFPTLFQLYRGGQLS
jgi:hypothetical protein